MLSIFKAAATRLSVPAVLLAGSLMAEAPAHAAVMTFDSVGDTTTLSFNGYVSNLLTAGLTADVTYTLSTISGDQKTWTFNYSVTNTSSGPLTSSRVSGIGFNADTNPDVANPAPRSVSTGVFAGNIDAGNVPQLASLLGNGNRDVCISNVNCAGGGSGGVNLGLTFGGTFTLIFANAISALQTDDFYVRYQSINGGGFRDDSGVGLVVGVPEPATWAMMLIGFAGLGYAARRRVLAAQA